MDWKIELVAVPVTDVDRAKAFYVDQVGFHADHDHQVNEQLRFVQLTPPGSACSIAFGVGVIDRAAGAAYGLQLVVEDIEAVRADLISHGADVSEAWHGPGLDNVEKRLPGPDPDHNTYRSFATSP